MQILKANHEGLVEEGGHRGINSVTRKVLMNYEWATGKVYEDAKVYVSFCEACQRCAPKLPPEPIYITATSWIFDKIFIDCIGPLPRTTAGHEHIVVAVEDLTGFMEGRALKRKTSENIARFLWEEIVLATSNKP